jgi:uncharacterized membrane protein
MLSNTTLDAAKTSRMIQLLQTQADLENLKELAWGILVEDDHVITINLCIHHNLCFSLTLDRFIIFYLLFHLYS